MAQPSVPANFRYRLAWWLPAARVLLIAVLIVGLNEIWPEVDQAWALGWIVAGAAIGIAGLSASATLDKRRRGNPDQSHAAALDRLAAQASASPAKWAALSAISAFLCVIACAAFVSAEDTPYLLAGGTAALIAVTLIEFAVPARQKWWRVEERPAFKWSAIDAGLNRAQAKTLAGRFLARQARERSAATAPVEGEPGLDDMELATTVAIDRSQRLFWIFGIGGGALAAAVSTPGSASFWVFLACGVLACWLGVWMLKTSRIWRVDTIRAGRRSVVFDGLTLDAANGMAEAIREAGGLRKRALGWKLPAGGRKGFWGGS